MRCFKDQNDGVYQVELPAGEEIPEWLSDMTEMTEAEVAEAFPPTLPTPADVNIERDRRIAAGTTLAVTGYGGIPLTGTPSDMTVITALLVKAQGYKAAGVTDPVMVIRDKDNTTHNLTPVQMIELTSSGMQWVEDTMAVSWSMKDGISPFEAGIPADYATNESYWP